MPQYNYRNPKSGKIVTIIQRMGEPHVYSENGVEFERQFSVPHAAVDTQIDPLNSKDFAAKTANKKGTVGDLWDASRDLSDKRERLIGKDTVKENYYKDYAKKRKGKQHQDVARKQAQESIDKISGISVEF